MEEEHKQNMNQTKGYEMNQQSVKENNKDMKETSKDKLK